MRKRDEAGNLHDFVKWLNFQLIDFIGFIKLSEIGTPLAIYLITLPPHAGADFEKNRSYRMKKFVIAAATATTLTLTMAGAAFAQTAVQSPMVLAANTTTQEVKEDTSDTWITTKVKADLLTEKGIPGSDIKVETNKGVVSLSSTVAVTDSQKKMAVEITKKIKGVKDVSAAGLKAE